MKLTKTMVRNLSYWACLMVNAAAISIVADGPYVAKLVAGFVSGCCGGAAYLIGKYL